MFFFCDGKSLFPFVRDVVIESYCMSAFVLIVFFGGEIVCNSKKQKTG